MTAAKLSEDITLVINRAMAKGIYELLAQQPYNLVGRGARALSDAIEAAEEKEAANAAHEEGSAGPVASSDRNAARIADED